LVIIFPRVLTLFVYRYDLMNYQQIGDGEYDYVHVGSWISGGDLNIFRPLQWSADEISVSEPPESYCSKPCAKGYAKVTNH
jgi:hypothetical protein